MTALGLHEQTSQATFEVWIAIGNMAHLMRLDHPSLRIVRVSPAALATGKESSQLESAPVRVISAAKTVARVHGTLYRHQRPDQTGSSRSHFLGHRLPPTHSGH